MMIQAAAYLTGCSKGLNGGGLNRQVKVLGDVVSACHNGDIIEQCLPALAKAGGLDGTHLHDCIHNQARHL